MSPANSVIIQIYNFYESSVQDRLEKPRWRNNKVRNAFNFPVSTINREGELTKLEVLVEQDGDLMKYFSKAFPIPEGCSQEKLARLYEYFLTENVVGDSLLFYGFLPDGDKHSVCVVARVPVTEDIEDNLFNFIEIRASYEKYLIDLEDNLIDLIDDLPGDKE